MMFAHVDKI